jgi:LPXTG-motif cell wall-anchored protein
LSYKSSDGETGGATRVMLWGAAGLVGLVLAGWTLMRRRHGTTAS